MKKILTIILTLFTLPPFLGRAEVGLQEGWSSAPIPDAVWERMQGKSYTDNPYIKRSDLRYLRLLYVDKEGKEHIGEMVCNKAIADDLIAIFRELYRQRYPIERMQLIDDFDADDEKSMRANNTSCFCLRIVKGSNKLSKHAQGLAVDINPLYNPYVKVGKDGKRTIQPSNAAAYCNRQGKYPYKITAGDKCHKLFIQHGYRWGGAWRTLKDYQHFEK